ncbi:MAG: amino acid ABC transporter substrate-binding protein [marine bacterium B5-7]|nr:MAG: amino acid ABC transporter substrate-binding protein [marine bacterium B5-7]
MVINKFVRKVQKLCHRCTFYELPFSAQSILGASLQSLTSRTPLIVVACLMPAIMMNSSSVFGGTLDEVLERGYVKCAIGNRPVGDTRIGESGYEGFFPEFCRIIALALFNDRNAVLMSPMLIRHGLQSISERDVDVYVSNVTWTFSRDMELGLTPAAVLYYDGQGFLSHLGTVPGAITDLKTATVCVSRATTTIVNLKDYIKINNLEWEVLEFESSEGRNDAFFSRRCDLLTSDRLVLATTRSTAVENPDNYVLHDEVISSEPLVAYVNVDDMVWGNVVRWTIFATIFAEEKGISRENYTEFLDSPDPSIRRLLGVDPMTGSANVGLDPQWARNIIAGSGNYGEIFDRYLGRHSEMNISRGANRSWKGGGLLFSPPLR